MKSMSLAKPQNHRKFRPRVSLVAIAVAGCFISPVYANGINPNVVAGSATFDQSGSTQIVKNINGTIINWDALSVAKGETLFFDQAAGSSVLNRVIGVMINGQRVISPTEILGRITSQGTVAIVNTAGLMIAPGAVIDVARFIGSTIDITNENFLAGKLLFDVPSTSPMFATVKNQGTITTSSGGSVYLIGSEVINEGTITTPGGEVLLAAGHTVSLIDTGTPGVKVEITGTAGKVTNLGTVLADAGRIGMVGALVRNSGTLNASSVVNEGGRIFLRASQDAYVDGNGRIVTTGTKGGAVEVLGNRVAITDQASINASGASGGGEVLIGGDYQGRNPTIQNSQVTYFGKNASIRADAIEQGDGGKVILWAGDTTRAYGNISARGGSRGGNGGFVETSGHRYLDVSGLRVNTLAVLGKAGSWLLDPTDITVTHGSVGSANFSGGVFDNGSGNSSTVTDGDINAALTTTNVTVTTSSGGGGSGDITLQAGVAIANGSGTPRDLTLTADRYINFGDGTTTGTISINSGAGLNLYLDSQNGVFTKTGTTLSLTGGSSASNGLLVQVQNGKTWQNDGTINLSGYSQIHLWDGSNTATFLNNHIFNTSSTAGWFFTTDGASNQGGVITNNGTFNVNVGGSIEAEFDQGSSGTLSIANGQTLSMQNAGVVQGTVNTNGSGTFWISEHHRGNDAIQLTGTTFLGTGTLKVDLTSAAGTNGNSNEVSFSNVTASGLGSIILNTNGGILSVLNGSSLTAATSLTANVGNLLVQGSRLISNGTMNLTSSSYITVQGTSVYGASIRAAGNQTLTAGSGVTVQGAASGSNGSAVVESQSGTQTISANIINVYGGGTTGGGDYSGNSAQILANGTQLINVTGPNGILRLTGGGNAGYGGFGNYALIRQNATGGQQQISYTGSGGSLYVTGGNSTSSGYNNKAEIDGHYGNQTIGDVTHRPNIILRGGNSGGQFGSGNDASIGLDDHQDGTQTVYAGEIGIYGGTANFGGAGFGAPHQRFDLSGNLTMEGGSSLSVDEDGVPGGAVFIGSKYGADIQMTVGGDVLLKGGSGSPVIIGSLTGTADVSIHTATARSVTIYSDTYGQHGGVFIGSIAEFGSTSPLTGNDVMLGSNTSIVSGANVVIQSSGGNVGLGYIEAAAGAGYGATITAHGAILDQNGSALNIQADSITLLSESGGSATSIAISADTKITQATGTLSAKVNSGSNYGGISIRNTDDVGFGTQGSISLNDSAYYGGMGSEGGRFSLRFYNSGNLDLSTISVNAADELNDTSILSGGNMLIGSGDFYADNVLLGAAGNVTVTEDADLYTSGKLTVLSGQTLSMSSNSSVHSEWDLVVAAGGLSMDSDSVLRSSEGNVSIATGALTIDRTTLASYSGVSTTSGTVSLGSGASIGAQNGSVSITTDGLTMDNSEVSGYSGLTVTAGNISANHSSFQAGASEGWNSEADATFKVSGNMRLNDGSYINAGNDVYMTFSGKTSTLYLNDLPNKSAAYVLSDIGTQVPATTHLSFTSRASGGVYIDGIESLTTSVGKSGFFSVSMLNPSSANNGLDITYPAVVSSAGSSSLVTNEITKELNKTSNNNILSRSSPSAPIVLASGAASSGSGQSTGGESEDSFGGSEKKSAKGDGSNSNNNNKDQSNGKPAAKNYCN